MPDMTLKNLAEYVMNEVATKKETDERFDKVDERLDKVDERLDKVDERLDKVDERLDKVDDRLNRLTNYVLKEIPEIKNSLEEKADKKDIQTILEGQDQIMKQLDIIRTEQLATSATLDRHEQRFEALEARIDR